MTTPADRTNALIQLIVLATDLQSHKHIRKDIRAALHNALLHMPSMAELEKPGEIFQRIEPWIGGPLDMQPHGEGTIVHMFPPEYVWEKARRAEVTR